MSSNDVQIRVNIIVKDILYTIYDIFLKREIDVPKGQRREFADSINCDPTALSHLKCGKKGSINDRYILPENKHLIFTFVDNEGVEYPCITNTSLFVQLNRHQTQNDMKYISAVKRKKQKYVSIDGQLYHIKEHFVEGQYPTGAVKAMTEELSEIRERNQLKKKIVNRLRTRLSHAMKAQLTSKKKRTLDLLGIPLGEFLIYMESQFTEGMSWDNYGTWHIDHIKPCSKFDLFLRSEQEECFHYSNLQPLWGWENFEKRAKYPYLPEDL